VLTHFGERPDISPDNKRIAFMAKSFGDAFLMDLDTRIVRCLTCSLPGATFLRVMFLPTGDYLLFGPEQVDKADIQTSRHRDNHLWFLSKQPGSKPVKLNQTVNEGAAISKKQMRIAFTRLADHDPSLAIDQSQLFVADLDISGGAPRLANKQMVYEHRDKECILEAQDFLENDSRLTLTCYGPRFATSHPVVFDLASRKLEDVTKAPGTYNECEGIFPDGKYSAVEMDRQKETLGGGGGIPNIDIWKLKLDGTGKDMQRLTFFNDYEGFKASNPVVATNGTFMAFQVGKSGDDAGVGYGILLYRFR
jgi:Tol biopolymer transport system component